MGSAAVRDALLNLTGISVCGERGLAPYRARTPGLPAFAAPGLTSALARDGVCPRGRAGVLGKTGLSARRLDPRRERLRRDVVFFRVLGDDEVEGSPLTAVGCVGHVDVERGHIVAIVDAVGVA